MMWLGTGHHRAQGLARRDDRDTIKRSFMSKLPWSASGEATNENSSRTPSVVQASYRGEARVREDGTYGVWVI